MKVKRLGIIFVIAALTAVVFHGIFTTSVAGHAVPDIATRPADFPWSPGETISDSYLCGEQATPDVATDANGNAYAVWSDCRDNNWDIYFAHRPIGGVWSADIKINDEPAGIWQSYPKIVANDMGTLYAIWIGHNNGSLNVYFSYQPAGGTWSASVRVNDITGSVVHGEIDIAIDNDGGTYAVWTDEREGDTNIYFSHRSAEGNWSADSKINDDTGIAAQNNPAISVGPTGNAYVVWQDARNDDGDIYFASRSTGGHWTPNIKINDDTSEETQKMPAIAVDAADNVYTLWMDSRRGFYQWEVFFSQRLAGQNWTNSSRVNNRTCYDWCGFPAIAADIEGNLYAAWANEDYYIPWSSEDNIYFSYRPAGGAWGVEVRINDDLEDASQTMPEIAADNKGNAYAVWMDFRNDNWDVYFAQRPAGDAWSANERVNENTGQVWQLFPDIAVDDAGNTYAVWQDNRNGNWDIYFAYRPAGGGWGANLRINDDTGGAGQGGSAIAVDGTGNAYAVWQDNRNGNWDIYFAYRPAGGNWGANLKVNDDTDEAAQSAPDIAVDETGGAYVVWTDDRNSTERNLDPDIYFSFRPVGGSWGADERVNDDIFDMDTARDRQYNPVIAVDDDGNAYVAWEDYRNDDWDIYSAHRPVGGGWTANTKINDDADNANQREPAIAVDGAGEVYALWRDSRKAYAVWDLYSATFQASETWGENHKVNDDTGGVWEGYPDIAADDKGNTYAVWVDERDASEPGDWDVYFAYRPSGGSWGTDTKIQDNAGIPVIAVDAFGNAYAIWVDDPYATVPHIYFSVALHDNIISLVPTPTLTPTATSTPTPIFVLTPTSSPSPSPTPQPALYLPLIHG